MTQTNAKEFNEPMVKHRSAPLPETLVEMAGIPMETANAIRDLIKNTDKDEILNSGRFPKTASAYHTSPQTDVDLLMNAICECMGGKEVRKMPINTPTKSYHLHHVVTSDPDARSIGLNDDWGNFYVRSLNEVLRNVERHNREENQPVPEK